MEYNYPMILVFYFDREMMQNQTIVETITQSISTAIEDDNMRAFLIPTDGPERVECINPALASAEEREKIETILADLENRFDIGKGADEGKNDEKNIVDLLSAIFTSFAI